MVSTGRSWVAVAALGFGVALGSVFSPAGQAVADPGAPVDPGVAQPVTDQNADAVATARMLLGVTVAATAADAAATTDNEPQAQVLPTPCPCCGARMRIIETFARGCEPKHRPASAMVRIDTS